MKTYKFFGLLTILALLIVGLPMISAGAASATLYVDVNENCDGNLQCYPHPQDAVNAANPGDTILVYPGTYGSRQYTFTPPHWSQNDQWAPALIVYKDNLTIKAVDSDPVNTIIESTHNFWSNPVAIQASTGGTWNGSQYVGAGVYPQNGTAPNAISIVANGVTIDGFTIHRPFNSTIGGHSTVLIGGLFSGDTQFLGAGGATIKNNAIIDSNGAIDIWHSSDNVIEGNLIYNAHNRAISVYDGYTDATIDLGYPSQRNQFIGNEIYQAWGGIFVGAWAPATLRTDNSGTVIQNNNFHDLTDFAVGFAYTDSSDVVISGNEMVNVPAGVRTDLKWGGTSSFANLMITDNNMRPSQWGILAYDVAGATIADNDIRDISTYWALAFFDSVDVRIENNDILNNAYGITPIDSIGTEVHYNNIVGNDSNEPALRNWSLASNGPSQDFPVDATCNWWGAADGPGGVGSGSGDEVNDYVIYQPWLTSEAPSDCDGEGPLARDITPSTVAINTQFTIAAVVDDTNFGGTVIASAEYQLDDGSWTAMSADDNAFYDEVVEEVEASHAGYAETGIHKICVRGTDAAGNTGIEECSLLAVYDPSGGFVTGGGWIDSPAGAVGPSIAYFNGFESDIDGWLTPTRVMSGTNGIPSASGDYHAEATTDFTRWGGYNSVFPNGGFITAIDIYLDMDAGFINDTRFDWTSAINGTDGNHRRDFIFNGGFYNDLDGPGAGQNRFVFSASNNVPGWPKNPGRDPIAIAITGWYTLQHRFYDSGAGVLAVDLSILDDAGSLIHTWTLSDPSDVIDITVGGNRYGWFARNGFPFLAIDNSVRKELSNIVGKATFGFVSKYKKGASVPEGNTEFQFKAGDLNFHSTSYDWLVVTGSDFAKFKGTGTINGEGTYKFQIWAGDGDPDTFRIKIWEEDEFGTETVVYDNGSNQEIGGGSIVVHTKK